ncbi:MAG: TonB family protein [Betaproteobacteria bacterium]|nr:TonB family protein [Betaproteobacteria bacterium]
MKWAWALSLLVHMGVMSIQLGAPEQMGRLVRDSGLEVILVNTNTDEKEPTKAKALAQTNLAGGGDLTQARATSPLVHAKQSQTGQADDQLSTHLTKREMEQTALLAQTKHMLAALNNKTATQSDPALERQRQQLLKMLAQIEKRMQEENARPRKRYVSPSTQEVSYALYYDQLRQKIEARGTLYFPEVQGQKLYGSLIMVITIDASGQVVSEEIVQSSGNPVLDMQAKAIAHASGPFGPFSDEMRRQMDQLALVTRFSFDRSNTLQTTLQSE